MPQWHSASTHRVQGLRIGLGKTLKRPDTQSGFAPVNQCLRHQHPFRPDPSMVLHWWEGSALVCYNITCEGLPLLFAARCPAAAAAAWSSAAAFSGLDRLRCLRWLCLEGLEASISTSSIPALGQLTKLTRLQLLNCKGFQPILLSGMMELQVSRSRASSEGAKGVTLRADVWGMITTTLGWWGQARRDGAAGGCTAC